MLSVSLVFFIGLNRCSKSTSTLSLLNSFADQLLNDDRVTLSVDIFHNLANDSHDWTVIATNNLLDNIVVFRVINSGVDSVLNLRCQVCSANETLVFCDF